MSIPTSKAEVRHGVDLEAFGRFTEYATAHPEDVQFVLEARGVYEGRAAHTRAGTGPYTLGGRRIERVAREYVYHIGAHREVEEALGFTEPTDREEPTEVALAALTACINTAVSASALARGIELSRLETRVSIGWDPFVFLHLRDPIEHGDLINQFEGMKVRIVVDGDDLTDTDRAYLQDSVRRSAVYNLFTLGHQNTPTVELA
ncbi:MAG TPA: OsmC family protein [Gemmatimonadaceae bacterium]